VSSAHPDHETVAGCSTTSSASSAAAASSAAILPDGAGLAAAAGLASTTAVPRPATRTTPVTTVRNDLLDDLLNAIDAPSPRVSRHAAWLVVVSLPALPSGHVHAVFGSG